MDIYLCPIETTASDTVTIVIRAENNTFLSITSSVCLTESDRYSTFPHVFNDVVTFHCSSNFSAHYRTSVKSRLMSRNATISSS